MQTIQRQMENTNIDKRAVLDFFKKEEEALKDKLKAVVQARETIEKFLGEYRDIADESPDTGNAIFKKPDRTHKRYEIPTFYDKNSKYGEKILFILNKLGEATTPQIIQYIIDEEPQTNVTKVHINVGKACSRLLTDGKVMMEKQGNTNRYRLA